MSSVNNTNSSLIFQAASLSQEIYSKPPIDALENDLDRASRRVNGVLIGFLLTGPVAGGFLFDAETDGTKLKKIQAKLADLEQALPFLDRKSPDYGQAIAAHDFQKQVYHKVKDYTKTAQTLKYIMAAESFVWALANTMLLVSGHTGGSSWDAVAENVSSLGFWTLVPTAIYSLYRSNVQGAKLDEAKQQHAQKFTATQLALS